MKKIVLTDTAETVLKRRYYIKNSNGNTVEDWEALCKRVAKAIASVESNSEDRINYEQLFFKMIYNLDVLPNSPCLMNAGTELSQLSACFVLPVEDSMDGIFTAIRNGALVNKSGGGTGYDFSKIRPKNSTVLSTQGVASGPLSFMTIFNESTNVIKQGGKRRGANMGCLRIDHPDIIDFIEAKQDQTKYTNFNLSVAITDNFMEAVKNKQDFSLIDPNTKKIVGTINAEKTFNRIIELAWYNGEPGILFIDAANRNNPTPQIGNFAATNPCWEGNTKVWTSEGPKRFIDLAQSGDDVLVLSQDDAGRLCYKMMRNPRKTASNAELVEITFDNGAKVTCTPNHNLYLRDGRKVQAKDLQHGDSVASLYRYNAKEVGCSSYTVCKRLGWERPETVNHKVVSVVNLGTRKDVYNGTVDDTHRYFVMCGENDAILSANCGEQWLLPFESCTLGSINLSNFITYDTLTYKNRVDWLRLKYITNQAVRFLDNLIDCNKFPIPEIHNQTHLTRKIGLGIMGLHDMLIQLEIPYASKEGQELAAEVMNYIHKTALAYSEYLAEIKEPFPAYDPDINAYKPRRNASLTSIQPTGTVSMIADCSSGCEPYFSIVMMKNVMDNDHLIMVNKHFEQVAKREGFYSKELMEKVAKSGTVIGHSEIPIKYQNIFRTAQDISPKQHIQMQSILQNNGVDSSISKTINLPNNATKEDVYKSYFQAWESGCKGVTVYRDGSRDNQVLNTLNQENKKENNIKEEIQETYKNNEVIPYKKELADILNAKRYRLVGSDNLTIYVIVCFDEYENPVEVFAKFPFDNQCDSKDKSTMWTTLCRVISLALRCSIPIEEIIKQLDKSSGHMNDLPAQLSKLFKTFVSTTQKGFSSKCPECGCKSMIFEEGCENCKSCGYSKCS